MAVLFALVIISNRGAGRSILIFQAGETFGCWVNDGVIFQGGGQYPLVTLSGSLHDIAYVQKHKINSNVVIKVYFLI